jgi:predicted dehydrogenase
MTSFGFVGAGLIGRERIKAFATLSGEDTSLRAVGVVDPHQPQVATLAASIGAPVLDDVAGLIVARPDIVCIAVPHDVALSLSAPILAAGIRVLLEKPIGRTMDEARAIASLQVYPDQLLIGHNYRFFKGVRALFSDLRRGFFGTPVSLSFLLGHGGSPDDFKGWKLDPVRAGGGCLIDPGIHLLDLACQADRGDLVVRGGTCWSGFWKTGIEEDCHLILSGSVIPTIGMSVSVVRWRSTFRIELFGTDGYGVVEGRGRSYGPQTYRRGQRWGWQSGRSQAESEEFVVTSTGDEVFLDEMKAILHPPEDGPSVATAEEALRAMALLRDCRAELGLRDKFE